METYISTNGKIHLNRFISGNGNIQSYQDMGIRKWETYETAIGKIYSNAYIPEDANL